MATTVRVNTKFTEEGNAVRADIKQWLNDQPCDTDFVPSSWSIADITHNVSIDHENIALMFRLVFIDNVVAVP